MTDVVHMLIGRFDKWQTYYFFRLVLFGGKLFLKYINIQFCILFSNSTSRKMHNKQNFDNAFYYRSLVLNGCLVETLCSTALSDALPIKTPFGMDINGYIGCILAVLLNNDKHLEAMQLCDRFGVPGLVKVVGKDFFFQQKFKLKSSDRCGKYHSLERQLAAGQKVVKRYTGTDNLVFNGREKGYVFYCHSHHLNIY